jgi:hypothetical protein
VENRGTDKSFYLLAGLIEKTAEYVALSTGSNTFDVEKVGVEGCNKTHCLATTSLAKSTLEGEDTFTFKHGRFFGALHGGVQGVQSKANDRSRVELVEVGVVGAGGW